MMQKNSTFYAKRASSSLVLLWIGAIFLLIIMLYNWRTKAEGFDVKGIISKPKGIFVDQLLLSSQDLQLGESVNLINITLNRDFPVETFEEQDQIGNTSSPERKLVYSKILKNKIKNISAAPAANNGFIIKPLPQ